MTVEAAKRYRLLYRLPDGSATYEATTGEDAELLTIHADGSRSRHVVVGLRAAEFRQAYPDKGGYIPPAVVPVREDVEVVEPFRAMPSRPVQEPVKAEAEAPTPEPARGHVEAESAAEGRSRWERILSWGPGPGGGW